LRRPVRCPWCQLIPVMFVCPCSALDAAARSDSLRLCALVNELALRVSPHSCAGISCLRGAGWRRPSCQSALRSCMRGCAASRGSVKPDTLRILVVGSCVSELPVCQASAVQCSVLGASTLRTGFTLQGSAIRTQRVRSRHVSTRLSCTIRL
jgi:hypothetical protein